MRRRNILAAKGARGPRRRASSRRTYRKRARAARVRVPERGRRQHSNATKISPNGPRLSEFRSAAGTSRRRAPVLSSSTCRWPSELSSARPARRRRLPLRRRRSARRDVPASGAVRSRRRGAAASRCRGVAAAVALRQPAGLHLSHLPSAEKFSRAPEFKICPRASAKQAPRASRDRISPRRDAPTPCPRRSWRRRDRPRSLAGSFPSPRPDWRSSSPSVGHPFWLGRVVGACSAALAAFLCAFWLEALKRASARSRRGDLGWRGTGVTPVTRPWLATTP